MGQFSNLSINTSITAKDIPTVNAYFKDVRNYKLLSEEQEQELGRRILEGDQRAVDELVRHNLRFVITVAKLFQGQGLCFEDLIQEGNKGLVVVANRFDYRKGRFLTIAYPYIKSTIMIALRKVGNMVKVPSPIARQQYQATMLRSRMENELGRPLDVYDIPEGDESVDPNLREALFLNTGCVSLDETVGYEDEGCSRSDQLKSDYLGDTDDNMERESLKQAVNAALSTLKPRDREVMEMLFGIGRNQCNSKEVAVHMNLTNERVCQIRRSSLAALRQNTASGLFKAYC